MIVHAAAHLFADGDLAGGLRNLWDIDRLLREFAAHDGFWQSLAERARRHRLEAPVARALRLAHSSTTRRWTRSWRAGRRFRTACSSAGCSPATAGGRRRARRSALRLLRPLALAADAAADAGAASVDQGPKLVANEMKIDPAHGYLAPVRRYGNGKISVR